MHNRPIGICDYKHNLHQTKLIRQQKKNKEIYIIYNMQITAMYIWTPKNGEHRSTVSTWPPRYRWISLKHNLNWLHSVHLIFLVFEALEHRAVEMPQVCVVISGPSILWQKQWLALLLRTQPGPQQQQEESRQLMNHPHHHPYQWNHSWWACCLFWWKDMAYPEWVKHKKIYGIWLMLMRSL